MTAQENQRLREIRQASEATAARLNRESDIRQGEKFGQKVLGPEGLGRLGTDPRIEKTLSGFEELAGGLTTQ